MTTGAKDPYDVWMLELLENVRFAFEASQGLLVSREGH